MRSLIPRNPLEFHQLGRSRMGKNFKLWKERKNSHAHEHPDATPSMEFNQSRKRLKLWYLNSRKRPRKILGVKKKWASDVDLGDLILELFSDFY